MVETGEQGLFIERPHDRLIVVRKSADEPINYSYIFIHGLNESGDYYLKKIVDDKIFPIPHNFRVLLPNAPVQFVTRLGKESTSWYDLNNLDMYDPKRYGEE